MKKFNIYLAAIITTLCVICFAFSKQEQDPDTFKSVYLYQFIKYIEWSGPKDGNFTIGVLGNSSIKTYLDKMAATKKAGEQTIVIKEWSSVDAIGNCQVLYIPNSRAGDIAAASTKVNGKSVLIVSESNGAISKGSCINFIREGNSIKFELSKTNINAQGLKVSSSLLKLANVTD